jgi:NAD(P)-dependent dehydrogenase (short-subunit alcohol dehydrogenase family)
MADCALAEKELPEQVVMVRADAPPLVDADRVAGEIRDHFGVLDVVFLNAGTVRPSLAMLVRRNDRL